MATKKTIHALTPEQEKMLVKFRDEQWKIGTSTEPANREMAEQAISEAYVAIGQKPPLFVWMESPCGCAIAQHALSRMAEHPEIVTDIVTSRFRNNLKNRLTEKFGESLPINEIDNLVNCITIS